MNLSPATGTSCKPETSTGVAGVASESCLPKSSLNCLTLPKAVPATTQSPTLNVPF